MICLAVVIFLGQPLLVHLMFKTQARSPFWESTWGAGDLLGYIAGFEAFVGTVFLGVVAARQNEEANGISNKVLLQDMQLRIYEKMPAIEVTTKAPIEETWGVLFWGNRRFYSSLDSLLERGQSAIMNTSFPVIFQSIILKQKSFDSLQVSVSKFSLDLLDNALETTTIEMTNLLPFYSSIIQNMQDKEISINFAHSPNLYMGTSKIHGSLVINVTNSISYKYELIVEFSIHFKLEENESINYLLEIDDKRIRPIFEE